MSYLTSLDERYGESSFSTPADTRDAPSYLNSYYVITQDGVAYGNLTDQYLSADVDIYSLGALSTGYYSVDVDETTWDYSSANLGSVSYFQVLDSSGAVVSTSYSTFSDIQFVVTSPDTFYIKIVGSSSFSEQQYSATYTKTAELNSDAVWNSSASYTGSLMSGGEIDASVIYSDADGNTDGVLFTAWYLDGAYQGVSDTYSLTDSSIGKTLSFAFAFTDDKGNAEISPLYTAGVVDYGANASSFTSLDASQKLQITNITLLGTSNIDGYGNQNSNFITGNVGGNLLFGGGGYDTLNGGAGNDTLVGDSESDVLIGGTGRDQLYGQSGSDQFVFTRTNQTGNSSSTADVIHDFARGYDKISLSGIDAFAPTTNTNDAFIFRGTGSFTSSTRGEVRFKKYDLSGSSSDYTMVFIDTDGDTGAEASIRLSGLYNLTSSDFIL